MPGSARRVIDADLDLRHEMALAARNQLDMDSEWDKAKAPVIFLVVGGGRVDLS